MSTVLVLIIGALVVAQLGHAARRAVVVRRLASVRPEVRGSTAIGRRVVAYIEGAQLGMEASDVLRVWTAATVGSVLCIGVLPGRLGATLVIAALLGGPGVVVWARRRTARVGAQALADLLESTAAELRSGGTVISALGSIADGGGPLAADAGRIVERLRIGGRLAEALERWAAERDADPFTATAGALVTAHELGGQAAAALEGLAASLRDQIEVRAEVRAQSVQARASAWVVAGSPVVYLGLLAIAGSESFTYLVATTPGRALLVSGVTLLGLAALVFRRMLAGVGP